MNPVNVLQTLHGLTAEDRAWIIARLPARAKARLLAPTANERESHDREQLPAHLAKTDTLNLPPDVDAGSLATMLKAEPAWIAAALLQECEESLKAAVLERLPAVLRADISDIQRAGCKLTPLATQTLLRLLLTRIGHAKGGSPPSKFHSLLERLSASRSRKRLTIHL